VVASIVAGRDSPSPAAICVGGALAGLSAHWSSDARSTVQRGLKGPETGRRYRFAVHVGGGKKVYGLKVVLGVVAARTPQPNGDTRRADVAKAAAVTIAVGEGDRESRRTNRARPCIL
jgi:hypothetical protein